MAGGSHSVTRENPALLSPDPFYDIAPITLEGGTAIPAGLIINEIATNELKHGFSTRSSEEAVF